MSLISPIYSVAFVAAGAALGMFYFYVMYRTVRLHVVQASASRIVPLYLFRGGVALIVFFGIAQWGALPLILALLGFLFARLVVRRRMGSL